MPEIGATLREARMRAHIDVSEIEAQTKIRAKYLRALENEEWDLLPGPTVVKSFLRTYGEALGLDGRALVEEYKLGHERLSESDRVELGQQPIVGGSRGSARTRGVPSQSGPSRRYVIAVSAISLVIVLLVIGLLSRSGEKKPGVAAQSPSISGTLSRGRSHANGSTVGQTRTPAVARERVTVSIEPTGPVYVCLLGYHGRKVIPGLILQPGSGTRSYHSLSFLITLGNNNVLMTVDGVVQHVPASSRAIGYSITKTGPRPLAAARLPTCR
jgi:cytoskeletal protein RodZ